MTAAPLHILAFEEFRRRQATARAVVAARRMSQAEAEAHLRPWAAIATHCGADLPEAAALRANILRCLHTPAGRHGAEGDISTGAPTPPQADGMTRWLVAEEICPRARWAPVLIAARDLAFDRLAMGADELAPAAALHRIALALAHDVNGRHPIPGYDPAAARARSAARQADAQRKAA